MVCAAPNSVEAGARDRAARLRSSSACTRGAAARGARAATCAGWSCRRSRSTRSAALASLTPPLRAGAARLRGRDRRLRVRGLAVPRASDSEDPPGGAGTTRSTSSRRPSPRASRASTGPRSSASCAPTPATASANRPRSTATARRDRSSRRCSSRQQQLVQALLAGELGVKRDRDHVALADRDRMAVDRRRAPRRRRRARRPRGADEHGVDRAAVHAGDVEVGLERAQLAPERVARGVRCRARRGGRGRA